MGVEVAVAIGMGVMAAAQSFMSSEAQRAQSKYEAKVAASNAEAMRQQADLTRKQTEAAQRAKDREREQLRMDYETVSGSNRSLLAASGVDLGSGSASDVLIGNAGRFASDVGENRLQRAWIGWSGDREADLQDWQGDVYASQSSYLKRTAGSMGTSLLTAGMKGVMTGLTAYSMAGGAFGGAGSTPFSGAGFTGNVGDSTGTGGGFLMNGGRVSGL